MPIHVHFNTKQEFRGNQSIVPKLHDTKSASAPTSLIKKGDRRTASKI